MSVESSTQLTSNKRIVKNTAFLYMRMLLLLFINLYTARIFLNALGESDYGLYNVVGGIIVFFSVINGVLAAGTSRFLTYDLGKGNFVELKKTFSASFTMHAITALLVLLLSETVGLWFLNTQLVIPPDRIVAANWIYQFSVATAMLTLTQVPYSASIISHERMNVYAWAGVAEGVFKLAIAYSLIYINYTDRLIAYGFLLFAWSAILQLFYRFYCVKNFPETKLTIVKEKSVYKRMLSFSLWDLGGSLGTVANSQGMNFILNIFFGLIVNTARGLAVQVESALQQFSNNFMTAVKPQIVKSYAQNDYKRFFELIFESSKYSYFLMLVVALPVLLEAEYILRLWLVNVPQYTVVFLRWTLAASVFRSMARPVIDGCHATGNIKFLNLYTCSVVILTLPLSWIAFKIGYPPVATFIIYGLLLCLNNFVELFVLKKEVDYSIGNYLKDVMLRCLILTIFISIIPITIVITYEPTFLRLCLVVLASIISVGLSVFYFVLSSKQRVNVVASIKSRIIK